jgi:hypothetical protein
VPNEHIDQARLAAFELIYEIEATLKLLEQLPEGRAPSAKDHEDLQRLMAYRTEQIDAAVASVRGRLAGAVHLVLRRAEGG